MAKEEKYFYELSLFLSSNLNEEEVENKFNSLIKEIENLNGQILETNLPRLELLAYPIKKETSGYFGVVKFKIEAENLNELKKKIGLIPEILRFSLFKHEEFSQKPQKERILKEKHYKTIPKKEKSALEEKAAVSLDELEQKLNEILKE